MSKNCENCRHYAEEVCTNPRFRVHESSLYALIENAKLDHVVEEALEVCDIDDTGAKNHLYDVLVETIYAEFSDLTEMFITEPETFWCADYEAL